MGKVLIAVDEKEGSRSALQAFRKMIRKPEIVILVHVQRLQGDSLIIDMLGEPEMSTLRESLKGSKHKAALDMQSERILNFYKQEIKRDGSSVKTVTRDGVPHEEILKVAGQEGADLIVTGNSCKNIIQRLVRGSVSKELQKISPIPVLVAKCREKAVNRGSRERVNRPEWGLRPAKAAVSF